MPSGQGLRGPRLVQDDGGIDTAPSQFMPEALAFSAQRIQFGAMIQLSMKVHGSDRLFSSFHSALLAPPFPCRRY
jgi:hypothetical protein